MSSPRGTRHIAVVGGGVAGLAAACALAQDGYAVELFEQKPYVGGRASSYLHPGVGEVIDNCQHIVLGCCTNILDLLRRAGAEDAMRWSEGITFLEPGGQADEVEARATSRSAAQHAFVSDGRRRSVCGTRSRSHVPSQRFSGAAARRTTGRTLRIGCATQGRRRER